MAGEDVLSPKLLSTLSVRSSVSNSHAGKLRTSPGCGPKPTGKLLPPPAALGSLFGPTARTHEPKLKMLVPVVRRSAAPGTSKSKTVGFFVFLLSEGDPQPFVWAAPLGSLRPALRVCVWPVGGPLQLPVQLDHVPFPRTVLTAHTWIALPTNSGRRTSLAQCSAGGPPSERPSNLAREGLYQTGLRAQHPCPRKPRSPDSRRTVHHPH
jgi:hypothetical protein